MSQGNTYLWTGAASTDWNNAKNWDLVDGTKITSTNGVPGSSDSVLIVSGNTLNQAGYTYNGDSNAVNNLVKNMTPTLSGTSNITVANVTIGGNGGPATLNTGSTPFTVTGTLQDPQSAGIRNAQGGSYNLSGSQIHIVHLVWGTGGNVSYGSNGNPASVTVDWMSGAGQNDNGNNSKITVTKGYDVDSSGNPSFRSGQNGNNNWNIVYADGAQKRAPGSCYLPGSLIRTTRGDVPVESISTSDTVVSIVDGQTVMRPVVWTQTSHVVVNPALTDDTAEYPVRVVKNAFAEGVPYADLLVTPEHCLIVNGRFVPARMLVNGMSVYYDRSITAYDHYHFVTNEHSIVLANGLMSESCLDTSHRRAFNSQDAVVNLPARALTWAEDAAAPLDTSRDFVEPEYNALVARAQSLGLTDNRSVQRLTDDADLRLVTPTGKTLRPLTSDGRSVTFMLPPQASEVRVVSRTARPSETIGPFVDDRRHLGVLIGAVTLLEAGEATHIDAHLSAETLDGWNAVEAASCRWTSGYASLPLGARAEGYFGKLTIELVAAGPYIADEQDHIEAATSHVG